MAVFFSLSSVCRHSHPHPRQSDVTVSSRIWDAKPLRHVTPYSKCAVSFQNVKMNHSYWIMKYNVSLSIETKEYKQKIRLTLFLDFHMFQVQQRSCGLKFKKLGGPKLGYQILLAIFPSLLSKWDKHNSLEKILLYVFSGNSSIVARFEPHIRLRFFFLLRLLLFQKRTTVVKLAYVPVGSVGCHFPRVMCLVSSHSHLHS